MGTMTMVLNWNNSASQGDVKDVGEDIHQLIRTSSKNLRRELGWEEGEGLLHCDVVICLKPKGRHQCHRQIMLS